MKETELRKIYLENRRQAQIRIPDWAEAENLEQVMAQNSIWKIRSNPPKSILRIRKSKNRQGNNDSLGTDPRESTP